MKLRRKLERAAKRAGFQFDPTVVYEDGSLHGCYCDADSQEGWPWNPWTDDADAFELAVRLKMIIDPYAGIVAIPSGTAWATNDTGDTRAAVRHAIVEVAIGDGL